VNVRDGVKLGGNIGTDVLTGNVNRTWNIEEDVIGGSNATLTFNWLQQNEQLNFNRANSSVAHYIGSQWIFSTPSPALFTANGWWKQSQTGITSFSPFTISTPALTALPLNLLSFAAVKNKLVVDVNWATSNEINTNKFEIEYSIDGIVFIKVGEVVAAGNSSSVKDYSFTHLKPNTNGYNYYRLKMIDNDGSFKYTRIATVFIKDDIKQTIIAPNPVVDVLNIVEPSTTFITTVEVYDSKGALMISKIVNAETQVYSLPVSILAKGNYMLKVNYKTETKTFSFVK
jgi:hypothetical protein